MTARAARALFLFGLAACAILLGCGRVTEMHGEIRGLRETIKQAERNGAKRCAPRELATARAHADFAESELEQADMFRASDHLVIARAAARSAHDLSPPALCSERKFVMEEPKPAPGDQDGDGYPDDVDKCPTKPENFQGFEDEDGCPDDPDTDGDGIPDSRDQCELLAEDKDGFLDEDGCPDPDNDLDGLLDGSDKCPNEPEDPDGYQDEDGCPDLDNDGDGFADLDDECPMIPGVKDGKPGPGCPKAPTLVVVTDKEIKITQQIHFEFAKATIRPVSFPVLDAVWEVLDKNQNIKLEVQGHTDNVGGAQYNKRLSQDRADSVRRYLVSKGINPARLTSKGYGMDRPIVPNSTPRNRALNRRVQFVRTESGK
jgi:outer membrane protein OmpA-like peptidoglycan-associated protein